MRKARIIALISVLSVSVLLILPYVIEGFQWSEIEVILLYVIGFAALIGYFTTIPTPQKGEFKVKETKSGETKTVTSLACYGCQFAEEREFKSGDYVGKVAGECPKCQGERYVRTIYAIEEKRK